MKEKDLYFSMLKSLTIPKKSENDRVREYERAIPLRRIKLNL
jgi:hypothetical protein